MGSTRISRTYLAAKDDKARFIAFDLAMGVPGYNPIEYRLAIAPVGVGYEISDESLTQQRDKKPQPFKHIRGTSRRCSILRAEQQEEGAGSTELGLRPD